MKNVVAIAAWPNIMICGGVRSNISIVLLALIKKSRVDRKKIDGKLKNDFQKHLFFLLAINNFPHDLLKHSLLNNQCSLCALNG